MNVRDALRGHRMTRAFDGTELVEAQLVGLCEDALRAPTAGHSRGVDAIVLAGTSGVRRYLHVVCDPGAYASRYAAPDKVGSGLDDVAAWPVPYWFGDAAFATMALLLLAEEAGLAGCFLGAFRNEPDVLADVGAPRGRRLFGAVLLGHAASVQSRSSSLDRDGPSRADRVVRGGYPRD
jgi:nitroreductase